MTTLTIKAVDRTVCLATMLGFVLVFSIVGLLLNSTLHTESALKLLTAILVLEGLLRNPQRSISVATAAWFITLTFYSVYLNTWVLMTFIFVSTTILSLYVMTSMGKKERLFVILAWVTVLLTHLYLCLKEAFVVTLPFTLLVCVYALTASYMDIARLYSKKPSSVQSFYEKLGLLLKKLTRALNRTSASVFIIEHVNKTSAKIHRYCYHAIKCILETTKIFLHTISSIEISLDKLSQGAGLLEKIRGIELYINKLTNRVINLLLEVTGEFAKIESEVSSSFHRFVDKIESLQRDIVRSLTIILMIASTLLLIAILVYTLA